MGRQSLAGRAYRTLPPARIAEIKAALAGKSNAVAATLLGVSESAVSKYRLEFRTPGVPTNKPTPALHPSSRRSSGWVDPGTPDTEPSTEPSAAICSPADHDWKPHPTPPDAGYRWFRCSKCALLGHRHRGSGPMRGYRCTFGRPECNAPAIDRLPGRGGAGKYLWRCAKHRTPEPRG